MDQEGQISPRPEFASGRPGESARSGTLATLGRAIFLMSLPFGILAFVLPIYGQEIGANATII